MTYYKVCTKSERGDVWTICPGDQAHKYALDGLSVYDMSGNVINVADIDTSDGSVTIPQPVAIVEKGVAPR